MSYFYDLIYGIDDHLSVSKNSWKLTFTGEFKGGANEDDDAPMQKYQMKVEMHEIDKNK